MGCYLTKKDGYVVRRKCSVLGFSLIGVLRNSLASLADFVGNVHIGSLLSH